MSIQNTKMWGHLMKMKFQGKQKAMLSQHAINAIIYFSQNVVMILGIHALKYGAESIESNFILGDLVYLMKCRGLLGHVPGHVPTVQLPGDLY